MRRIPVRAVIALVLTSVVGAIDVGTTASIKASAKSIAGGLVQLYPNANSATDAGLFGGGYAWWESGAAFGSLIDYWALTGDSHYNSLVQSAISNQAGPSDNLLPTSQGPTEANSDQAIWALTALSAVEQNFSSGSTNYLNLAKSVFDQQVRRWDNSTCGGGLRSTLNSGDVAGYTFKDALSIGTFFQLAARLGLQTQNGTYTVWADKAYDWAAASGIIDSQSYNVYDGADTVTNCSSVNQVQWSANTAAFLYGSASMYNLTLNQVWVTRTQSLLNSANQTFFQNSVLYEPSCTNGCTLPQRAYKALLARWMARTAFVAPFVTSQIQQMLSQNGQAIADNCSGGQNSNCSIGGNFGLGEQMTALDSVNALLVGRAPEASPGSSSAGSTSTGAASTTATAKSAATFVGFSSTSLLVSFLFSLVYFLS